MYGKKVTIWKLCGYVFISDLAVIYAGSKFFKQRCRVITIIT